MKKERRYLKINSKKEYLLMPCLLRTVISWIILSNALFADEFILDSTDIMPYESWYAAPFINYLHNKQGANVELPALESKVGLDPNLHTRFILPVVRLRAPKRALSHYGYGDPHLDMKYRFFNDVKGSGYSAAIFPKFTIPIGNAKQGLGNGKLFVRLPFWVQKDWDNWKVTVGGGYAINQAKNQFNFFYGGPLIRNQVTKKLLLGIEFVAQGAANLNDKKFFVVNFGGQYNFTPNYFFQLSAGHSVAGANRLVGYIGFGTTWGPGI
ncbi:MAG TPA: hypothetical protein VMW10_04760 [Alphaproteobacteria bacterium]|nr:hypothetical protein [Alphaproteobacteria bacterium]